MASKLEVQRIDEEFEAVVQIEALEVEYAATAKYTGRTMHKLSRISQAIELLHNHQTSHRTFTVPETSPTGSVPSGQAPTAATHGNY